MGNVCLLDPTVDRLFSQNLLNKIGLLVIWQHPNPIGLCIAALQMWNVLNFWCSSLQYFESFYTAALQGPGSNIYASRHTGSFIEGFSVLYCRDVWKVGPPMMPRDRAAVCLIGGEIASPDPLRWWLLNEGKGAWRLLRAGSDCCRLRNYVENVCL